MNKIDTFIYTPKNTENSLEATALLLQWFSLHNTSSNYMKIASERLEQPTKCIHTMTTLRSKFG